MARKKKEAPQKTSYIQLELIPLTETEKIYKEFLEVKESSDKVRRGVFHKNTENSKKIEDLKCEIESLKHQMATLTQWMITRLGCVSTVQERPAGNLEACTSLAITSISAEYVNVKHQLQSQEISAILILSA